jgi:tetratricopeptide (TPR) repeat protein
MPKSSKAKKKQEPNIEANINIGGDVSGSNIIVGHGNTIINEAIKTEYTLFTIPTPVKDFRGRDHELELLKASFKNGALISGVSGGGGVGKTQLARRLAQEIGDDYPNARMGIDLLGTSNPLAPDEAMRRILKPFHPNQKLPDELEQLASLYQQTFSAQKALLLLDNASNAAQVRSLIPPAPSAAIVTSRQHFTLTEFDLIPLRLDVLSSDDSRALLKSASSKIREESDEEVNALAKLCGYLPLALRVAASILNDRLDWTLSHLLARLADERTRIQRLRRENDIDLDVDIALSLSYALLDNSLKPFFCQLGVFTAPFIKASAQAVWQIEDESEVDVVIGKLSSLSLLNILPSSLAGSIYQYELHDLTRLFSVNQLFKDESQAAQASLRHANHFLQWAAETEDIFKKGNENMLRALFEFRLIWTHLDSAYNRLLPEQASFPRAPRADEWLSKFPDTCRYLLELHLSPRRRIPILETALKAARRINDKQMEGAALGNLGLAYAALGDVRKAIEFYEQQLVIVREIGDRQREGGSLVNLGIVYYRLGDSQKAIELYEHALVILREIGNRRFEGNALVNLGLAYYSLANTRKAIEFYEQALVILREIGNRQSEGTALGNLGNAYRTLGDSRKAIQFHERALVILREIGDRRGEAGTLEYLGVAYQDLGDSGKAIRFFEKTLTIMREIEDRQGEGSSLVNLGVCYIDLGDAGKAIELFEQALAILRKIGQRRFEGIVLSDLGRAYVALGDARKAIGFCEQALAIGREIGNRSGEENALRNLGLAYVDLGNARKAIELFEQALVIDREIGDRPGEGKALEYLGSAYEKLGDKEKAIQYTEQALAIFEAIESLYAQQVRTHLANLRGETPAKSKKL